MKATDPQGLGGPPVPAEPGAHASEVPTRSGTPSVASSDAEQDSSDDDEEDEEDEEEEGGRASSELHGEEWDEEERMSTVQEGDVIHLELRRPRLALAPPSGFLHGDGLEQRVGLQSWAGDVAPLNFQDCLFRVCPLLDFFDQTELENFRRQYGNNDASGAASGGPNVKLLSPTSRSRAHKRRTLEKRALAESEENGRKLGLAVAGLRCRSVVYGSVYVLQHVRSQAFLSMGLRAAALEGTGLRLTLQQHGSRHAYFKFLPKHRIRTEGGPVYYHDGVLLAAAKLEDYRVSISRGPYPLLLNSYPIHEASLTQQSGGVFRVGKYLRPDPRTAPPSPSPSTSAGFLCCERLLRLFHPETESFLCGPVPAPGTLAFAAPSPGLQVVEDGQVQNVRNLCGKALWSIELPTRTRGGALTWATPYIRVRHVASDTYLARAPTPLQPKGGRTEALVYPLVLVRDEGEGQDDGVSDRLLFKLQRVENNDPTAPIPDRDVYLRLQQSVTDPSTGDSVTLQLHADLNSKATPPVSGEASEGPVGVGRVVLSSRLYQHDGLLLVPVAEWERQCMDSITRLRAVLCAFLHAWVSSPHTIRSAHVYRLQDAITALRTLCTQQPHHTATPATHAHAHPITLVSHKRPSTGKEGGVEEGQGEEGLGEWGSGAGSGEACNSEAQAMARDTRVLEALFLLTQLQQHRPTQGGSGSSGVASSEVCRLLEERVLPLAFAALTTLLHGHDDNQRYFASRTITLPSSHSEAKQGGGGVVRVSWIDAVIRLVHSNGAAAFLSALLKSNDELLERYVSNATVAHFRSLIGRWGPQARFMSFFAAICESEGRAIKSNQLICLSDLLQRHWQTNDTPLLLDTHIRVEPTHTQPEAPPMPMPMPQAVSDGEEDMMAVTSRGALSPRHPPSNSLASSSSNAFSLDLNNLGEGMVSKAPPPLANPPPLLQSLLGGKGVEEGGPWVLGWREAQAGAHYSLWLTWAGDTTWAPAKEGQQPSALYYSPQELGLQCDGEGWVRVEHLCWALCPEECYEPVFGQPWQDVKHTYIGAPDEGDTMSGQPSSRMLKFRRHVELAQYYQGQIELLAAVCAGRHASAQEVLQQRFPFPALLAMLPSRCLPATLRVALARLLHALWVDRYPHLPKCGRSHVPERLWMLDQLGSASASASPSVVLPWFQPPPDASASGSLKEGEEEKEEKEEKSEGPVGQEQLQAKFVLLQTYIEAFLQQHAHHPPPPSSLASPRPGWHGELRMLRELLLCLKSLIDFGFYSHVTRIRRLRALLLPALNKGLAAAPPPSSTRPPRVPVWWSLWLECQVLMVQVLGQLLSLQRHHRLAQLLAVFQRHHLTSVASGQPLSQCSSALQQVVVREVERLFTEDPQQDPFGTSRQAEEATLVRLLHTESDALVSEALQLLRLHHSQRASALGALQCVQLLPSGALHHQCYQSVPQLAVEVARLSRCLETVETWAGLTLDQVRMDDVAAMVSRLTDFASSGRGALDGTSSPRSEAQDLLSNLGLLHVLMAGLRVDSDLRRNVEGLQSSSLLGVQASRDRLTQIKASIAHCLLALVHQHPRNAAALAEHVGYLEECLLDKGPSDYFPGCPFLLAHAYSASPELLLPRLDSAIFAAVAFRLQCEPLTHDYLSFFEIHLAPEHHTNATAARTHLPPAAASPQASQLGAGGGLKSGAWQQRVQALVLRVLVHEALPHVRLTSVLRATLPATLTVAYPTITTRTTPALPTSSHPLTCPPPIITTLEAAQGVGEGPHVLALKGGRASPKARQGGGLPVVGKAAERRRQSIKTISATTYSYDALQAYVARYVRLLCLLVQEGGQGMQQQQAQNSVTLQRLLPLPHLFVFLSDHDPASAQLDPIAAPGSSTRKRGTPASPASPAARPLADFSQGLSFMRLAKRGPSPLQLAYLSVLRLVFVRGGAAGVGSGGSLEAEALRALPWGPLMQALAQAAYKMATTGPNHSQSATGAGTQLAAIGEGQPKERVSDDEEEARHAQLEAHFSGLAQILQVLREVGSWSMWPQLQVHEGTLRGIQGLLTQLLDRAQLPPNLANLVRGMLQHFTPAHHPTLSTASATGLDVTALPTDVGTLTSSAVLHMEEQLHAGNSKSPGSAFPSLAGRKGNGSTDSPLLLLKRDLASFQGLLAQSLELQAQVEGEKKQLLLLFGTDSPRRPSSSSNMLTKPNTTTSSSKGLARGSLSMIVSRGSARVAPLAPAAQPRPQPPGALGTQSRVSFSLLAQRLIRYARQALRQHKSSSGKGGNGAGLDNVMQVLALFTLYLDHEHSHDSSPPMATQPTPQDATQRHRGAWALAELRVRQDELNGLGLTDVLLGVLSGSEQGQGLTLAAYQLLALLLRGCNKAVQQRVYDYVTTTDADGTFFYRIRELLRWCRQETERLKASHLRTAKASAGGHNAASARRAGAERHMHEQVTLASVRLLRLLQALCEGHNRPMQDLLRCQTMNRRSYDLLADALDLLHAHAPSRGAVKRLQPLDLRTLKALLELLIETVQGPCPDNQVRVAAAKTILACKRLLTVQPFLALPPHASQHTPRRRAESRPSLTSKPAHGFMPLLARVGSMLVLGEAEEGEEELSDDADSSSDDDSEDDDDDARRADTRALEEEEEDEGEEEGQEADRFRAALRQREAALQQGEHGNDEGSRAEFCFQLSCVRSRVLTLVAALLEARSDNKDTHAAVADNLEADAVCARVLAIRKRFHTLHRLQHQGTHASLGGHMLTLKPLTRDEQEEDEGWGGWGALQLPSRPRSNALAAAAPVLSVDVSERVAALARKEEGELQKEVLSLLTVKNELQAAVEGFRRHYSHRLRARRALREAERYIGKGFASVEVQWKGQCSTQFFPLPPQVKCLTDTTKKSFMADVDLSSRETRTKALADAYEGCLNEMNTLWAMRHWAFYRLVQDHYIPVKGLTYAAAVFLNFASLTSTHSVGDEELIIGDNVSDNVLAIASLCCVCVLGYVTLVLFHLLTRMSLLRRAYRKALSSLLAPTHHPQSLKTTQDAGSSGDREELTNFSLHKELRKLARLVLGGAAYWLFYAIIRASLGGGARGYASLWWAAFLLLFLPPLAKRVRGLAEQYVKRTRQRLQVAMAAQLARQRLLLNTNNPGMPNNGLPYAAADLDATLGRRVGSGSLGAMGEGEEEGFSREKQMLGLVQSSLLVFELLTDRQLVTHVLLLVSVLMGLRWHFFFSLCLLDILTFSESLAIVITAVTRPARQLAFTAWLFLIALLIFGTFSIQFFGASHFIEPCTTRLQCFWWVLYYGFQGGAIWSALDPISANGYTGYFGARLVFDLGFYVILGILLFNLVTGIIIDTFTELRDDRAARESLLENECFVCGLSKAEYEQLGPDFSLPRHQAQDHHLWHYMSFMIALELKEEDDYTGTESYVRALLRAKDMSWVPRRTCKDMQDLAAAAGGDKAGASGEGEEGQEGEAEATSDDSTDKAASEATQQQAQQQQGSKRNPRTGRGRKDKGLSLNDGMATQQALLQQQVRELAVQVEALRALVKDTTTTAGHANRRAKIEQQAAERRRDGDRSERSEDGEQKKGDRPLAAENVFDKQFLEDA